MREVLISGLVKERITDLESYLIEQLRLSEDGALRRSDRMREILHKLSNEADYPLCRFKRWRLLGYRCAVFEKDWVFAYEVFDGGVIFRDMSHTTLLAE